MTQQSNTDIILGDMNAKFDAILEVVSPLVVLPAKIDIMQNDISELKSDMKVVKAAVTDLSKQVTDHEGRITVLETA